MFYLQWYISQTHSCVNAAGPRLAARCVKAKESLPLLRGRIHQNHQGIARLSSCLPVRQAQKSGRVADYVLLLSFQSLLSLSPPTPPFQNPNYTLLFLSAVSSVSLWKTALEPLHKITFNYIQACD